MKATVIKFFDAEGNEVKNVSTEIELNGELYVKKDKPNPDTVVGLKELPNDGKTYAECLEYVFTGGEIRMIKGLFYETKNGEIFNHENDNDSNRGFIIKGCYNDFTSHFRIHTPTPEPIWKTCREGMWGYEKSKALSGFTAAPQLKGAYLRNIKHIRAFLYLSEVARRCNGDRVVDWGDNSQEKFYVFRYRKELKNNYIYDTYKEIAFLDQEARDHSFEVDKHIWNDYFNLPNN